MVWPSLWVQVARERNLGEGEFIQDANLSPLILLKNQYSVNRVLCVLTACFSPFLYLVFL